MPILHSTIKHSPDRAALFRFFADSPTTTAQVLHRYRHRCCRHSPPALCLQRLQALTTGGLPTFLDVGR